MNPNMWLPDTEPTRPAWPTSAPTQALGPISADGAVAGRLDSFGRRTKEKQSVPRQACPRFINSLCVRYVLFLSLQLLTQRAQAAAAPGQQHANPIRHKGLPRPAPTNHLDIWDIMSIGQLVGGGGLSVSCLGYVCHVLMGGKQLALGCTFIELN